MGGGGGGGGGGEEMRGMEWREKGGGGSGNQGSNEGEETCMCIEKMS